MAELTKAQERLLRYPPNEETWECTRQVLRGKTYQGQIILLDVPGPCGTVISSGLTSCFVCGGKKDGRTSRKLYPLYLIACKVAKHTPGERWPPRPLAGDDQDGRARSGRSPRAAKKTVRRKKGEK